MSASARIFICYRRTDGAAVAEWLHSQLNVSSQPLSAYFDVRAAAVHDWTELHQRELESAAALLVVVTPGLFTNFGPKDWVHRELNWWIENRRTAPIVVETTGEGERWVPHAVRKKWPNIQRVELSTLVQVADTQSLAADQLVARIREGINANEMAEDLAQLATRRARVRFALTAVLVIALMAVVASISYLMGLQKDRELADAKKLISELRKQTPTPVQSAKIEDAKAASPEKFRKGSVKLWPNGTTLKVRFLDGSALQKSNVQKAFGQWLEYANLKLEVTNAPDAPIHVTFKQPEESWSFVGTDALGAASDEPTLMLGHAAEGAIPWNYVHEIGHTLGLVHETANPSAKLKWNKPAVYKTLTSPPYSWSLAQVDRNLFDTSEIYPGERPFDTQSIMLNELPASYFLDGIGLRPGTTLSKSDKQYVATLYPGR